MPFSYDWASLTNPPVLAVMAGMGEKMKKWVLRAVALCVLGYAVYWAYGFQRFGYLTLPDIPDGAYTLSYGNGLRAIVLDPDIPDRSGDTSPKYFRQLAIANRDRKYLGIPLEVQPWFKDAWSWCKAPTEEERSQLEQSSDELKNMVANARFEAVCRIDVDGEDIVRGLIFSVPRL